MKAKFLGTFLVAGFVASATWAQGRADFEDMRRARDAVKRVASERESANENKISWKADIALSPTWDERDQMAIEVQTFIPARDFNRITRDQNSDVEIRFYVKGEHDGGVGRALFKENGKFLTHWYLEAPVDGVVLGNDLVCPTPGEKVLTVNLTVRHRSDADERLGNKNYEQVEEKLTYTCLDNNKDNKKSISFQDKEPPELKADPNKSGVYHLAIGFNKDQFKAFSEKGSAYSVKLYASREVNSRRGQKVVKMQVGKNYKAPASDKDNNATRSYQYPLTDACSGPAANYWEDIMGKRVGLSCEITVLGSNGQPDYRYRPYRCKTEWVSCP